MSKSERTIKIGNYRNIIGNTRETIEAIQRYLQQFSAAPANPEEIGSTPCASINKVLDSTIDEELKSEVDKIIRRL